MSELQKDGRIRINELASRVGLSLPPCLRRVRSLRARGVITAIRATIDEKVLGYEVVSFVSIQLASQAKATLEAFEASIAACRSCCRAGGFREKRTFYSNASRLMSRGCISSSGSLLRCPRSEPSGAMPVLGVAKDAPLPIPGDRPPAPNRSGFGRTG